MLLPLVSRLCFIAVVTFTCVSFHCVLFAGGVAAQSPPDWTPYRTGGSTPEAKAKLIASRQVKWPSPVRLAGHEDVIDEMDLDAPVGSPAPVESASSPEQPASFGRVLHGQPIMGYVDPAPSHRVIRAPGSIPGGGRSLGHRFGDSANEHLPAPPIHGGHSKLSGKKWLHGPVQPKPATIPNAKQSGTWKQPYSYGYFGGSGSRKWSKHNGYRDHMTEYRYR